MRTEDLQRILDRVALYYGRPVDLLLSRVRVSEVSHARQVAVFLMRKHTNASISEIGRFFGRDHTTAMHCFRKIAMMVNGAPCDTWSPHTQRVIGKLVTGRDCATTRADIAAIEAQLWPARAVAQPSDIRVRTA